MFGKVDSGVFGDPTLVYVTKGKKVFELMRANWLLALKQFEQRR